MSFYQVVIPSLKKPLLYEVREDEGRSDLIGRRVLVPLKSKAVTGYLWEKAAPSGPGMEIKSVIRFLDDHPFFPETMVPFFSWIAEYYLCPLGLVLKTALPPGLSVFDFQKFSLTDQGKTALEQEDLPEEEQRLLTRLSRSKSRNLFRFSGEEKRLLKALERRGWVKEERAWQQDKASPRKEKWVLKGPRFQKDLFKPEDFPLFDFLSAHPAVPLRELRRHHSLSFQRLKTLTRKGLIEMEERDLSPDPLGEVIFEEKGPFCLTPYQEEALDRIGKGLAENTYQALLLHGATGSGKTEIYLRAAAETLARGRQVLVLVPEIGLIPLMEARFRLRFGEGIALLHSGLSERERLDQWRKIATGERPVVIGTRSAVFAPVKVPGLIVVDEEHDPSFKQGESLRYNARDLALVRGRLSSAVVVLGSATPSVTTLYLRRQKKLDYIGIPKRVRDRALPEIRVVDMKEFQKQRQLPIFSPPLREAIEKNLQEGHQTLLFLNRRGLDTLILCTLCGSVIRCRNCSLTLTHHIGRKLLCHTCGFEMPLPDSCPSCGRPGIKALGMGTEKVEKELSTLFPQAAVDRMDRDTVTGKRAYYRILKRLEERKTDILIGTQMITKGHDFPWVTLVGILSADLSLNWPDFRAVERTFQLLAQAAGRAGRGLHPGRVFIQTYNPDHYIFHYVRHHDYLGFYRREIRFRSEFGYPPFSRLIHCLIQGISESQVMEVSERLGILLREEVEKNHWDPILEILGPVQAPLAKIKGRHRWQLLLKSPNLHLLRQAAGMILKWEKALTQGRGIRIVLDVDPLDML